MKPKKLRMVQDCVAVRPVADNYEGKIILPDISQKREYWGDVVVVGPDCKDVAVGDRVAFGRWPGASLRFNGEELLIMRERDVDAIITEEKEDGKRN